MSLIDRAIEIHDSARRQAAELRWNHRIAEATMKQRHPDTTPEEAKEVGLRVAQLMKREVNMAELFCCSAPIGDLLWGAASTLPPMRLTDDLIPATSSLIVLEREVPGREIVSANVLAEGSPRPEPGWQERWNLVGIVAGYLSTGHPWPRGLHLVPIIEVGGTITPGGSFIWDIGSTIEDSLTRIHQAGDASPATMALIRKITPFVASFLLFINQRLIGSSRERPSRAARRRALQTGRPLPEINVVILRKRTYAGTGAHRDVEWACQWIVRGHWRQQWMPASQQHQPRWIAPYWKGPEDKPVKSPERTLFAVVR